MDGCNGQQSEPLHWKSELASRASQSYIQKLNAKNDGLYRLPTEAEWEYACRAGTTGPFGIGNGYVLDSSLANFDGNFPYGKGAKGEFRRQTTPVESFLPNAWGLYDMHGNVWEWCQDGYEKYSTESVTDPWGQNDSDIRVYRGGCWVDCGRQCRSAYRFSYYPDFKRYDLGFRLVMLV